MQLRQNASIVREPIIDASYFTTEPALIIMPQMSHPEVKLEK
jgi:hypothetical protein